MKGPKTSLTTALKATVLAALAASTGTAAIVHAGREPRAHAGDPLN